MGRWFERRIGLFTCFVSTYTPALTKQYGQRGPSAGTFIILLHSSYTYNNPSLLTLLLIKSIKTPSWVNAVYASLPAAHHVLAETVKSKEV